MTGETSADQAEDAGLDFDRFGVTGFLGKGFAFKIVLTASSRERGYREIGLLRSGVFRLFIMDEFLEA